MPNSLLGAQYDACQSMGWMNVWTVRSPALSPLIISYVRPICSKARQVNGAEVGESCHLLWLLTIYAHPDPLPSALCASSHLSLPVGLWSGYYPHVTDEKNSERPRNLLKATATSRGPRLESKSAWLQSQCFLHGLCCPWARQENTDEMVLWRL